MLSNVVLEKTLENPLEYKEIKPVDPKVIQVSVQMRLLRETF